MWMAVLAFAVVCMAPVGAAAPRVQADDCVETCADLTVSVEATNDVIGAGERFSYFLTVENDGPTNAEAVTLTNRLPASVSFVSAASESLQCTEVDRVVMCTTPMLELDGAAEVEVVLQAPEASGSIVNEAEVSSTTPELDPENNTTSLETEVGTGADLVLFAYAEDAAPGVPVLFHVAVLNDGPQTAHDVTLVDTLPAGVELVSVTSTSGTCAPPSARELNCTLDTVAAFDLVDLELVVSGIADGVLTNIGSVASTAPFDPDLTNNSDRETVVIGSPTVVDVSVSDDASTDLVGPGERFSYHLSIDNEGPANAASVTLTAPVPTGVRYVSADGLPCHAAGAVVTCAADDLEADGSVEVELVVEAPAAVRTLVNEARIASATPDLDASNNETSLSTRMGIGADLGIGMYAEPAQPTEPVHFFVSVWNDGPQSAREVVVEDLLPEGVDLMSATPEVGTCSAPAGRRLVCTLGTLAPYIEIPIEIVVSGVAEGVLTNVVSIVSTAPFDPDRDSNRTSHAAVVGNPPVTDLAVFNEGPEAAALDTELVYTLTVDNVGSELARDVRLTDRLAPGSSFLSVTTDTGTCSQSKETVSCELGDVGADEEISVEVRARAVERGRLTNVAEVVASGGPPESEPDSNTSIMRTHVGPPLVVVNDAFAVDEDATLDVAAQGVLENDSSLDAASLEALLVEDVDQGKLTLNVDGSFTYSPSPDFSGVDRFRYRASDGVSDSDVAAVTVTVKPVNDAPRASADHYDASQDTPLAVGPPGVLGNDSDVDSTILTAALVSGPVNGTVALASDGSFNYAARTGFHGIDSFTYKANDGGAGSDAATVTINVAQAPAPELRRLTVIRRGTGAGTVRSTPGGIDCGADCVEDLGVGTAVTLVARAAKGSRFASWGGACRGVVATCTVTMDAATSVTATFVKQKVVKRTLCFRKRTIKVPKSQVAKYKKKGARPGACKKTRKSR